MSQMTSWGSFGTDAPKKKKKKKKKLGNIQKTYVVEFPLNTNAQIQSTGY